MSEEVHNNEAKAESKEGVAEESNPIDMDAINQRLELLERTNERLLEESKGYKDKYRSLRDGVETEKKQKLEQEENWKELLDIEKNKSHTLQEQISDFKKNNLREKINFEVAKHAKDAFDVDDVIKSLPRDMISINEETLEVAGIDDAVSIVKERKPYLFNNKVSTGQPNSRPSVVNGKVGYDELSKEDKDALFVKSLGEF